MNQNIFTAQHGEDILLAEIFNRRHGTCIEVGGYDGVNLSNTLFFERIGWDCTIVEPMPKFCEKIRQERKCKVVEAAASSQAGEIDFFIAEGVEVLSTSSQRESDLERIQIAGAETQKIIVKAMTLDEILESQGIRNIDFISIDVEGDELSVLHGFSLEKYKPRIIIVEDNDVTVDYSVQNHLLKHNYRRFKRTGCNEWYAHKSDSLVTNFSKISASAKSVIPFIKGFTKTYMPAPLQSLIRKIINSNLQKSA
ncbi:FkbM family methyltransferase [Leptothoe sp. ISB3NOV94-8A]